MTTTPSDTDAPAAPAELRVRDYLRHVLRYGRRDRELGILAVSLVSIGLLLSLFGLLSTIAARIVSGPDVEGAGPGWVPGFVNALSLPQLMVVAVIVFAGALGTSLLVRIWITSEAYRMLERATLAAFEAIKDELSVTDAFISQYGGLIKSAVRYMSVVYLQLLALLFPLFLVLTILVIGLVFEPVLTLSIFGAVSLVIPVFLLQSRYAQKNSERLQTTLSARSAHIGRTVANLLRHPNRTLADDLSMSRYLDSEEGQAFRESYVHRQRVGAYSSAVSTLGTIAGITIVFLILSFGPEGWFSLANLILGVLLFRVLESNIGSLTKVAGNIRATLPFTKMAADLFERHEALKTDPPAPLQVEDAADDLPPLSALGSVVLTQSRFVRVTAERIGRAVMRARGQTGRDVVAINGDYDILDETFDAEVGPPALAHVEAEDLAEFETLERAAAFLALPAEARTQEAWSHLSQKGRFVLTALSMKEALQGSDRLLVINATDATLLTTEERDLLPWIFERRGTIIIFESVPYASRLPEELDLMSFDGRSLLRHGTMAAFDDVVDGIYADLALGLKRREEQEDLAEPIAEDALDIAGAAEDLEDGIEDIEDEASEAEADNPMSARRLGYAREIETTIWYERWLMARKKRLPPELEPDDGDDTPDDPDSDDPLDDLAAYRSAFGLNRAGRDIVEQRDLSRREAQQAAREQARAEQAEMMRALTHELRERKSDLAVARKTVETQSNHLSALQEKMDTVRNERDSLRERLTTGTRDASSAAAIAEKDRSRLEANLRSASEALRNFKEERDTLKEKLSATIREAGSVAHKAEREREKVQAQYAALNERFEVLSEERDMLRESLALKTREAAGADVQAERAQEKSQTLLDSMTRKLDEMRAERDALREALSVKIREAGSEANRSERLQERLSAQIEAQAKKIETVEAERNALREALSAKTREASQDAALAERAEDKAQARIAGLEERLETLEVERNSLRDTLNSTKREVAGSEKLAERAAEQSEIILKARDERIASLTETLNGVRGELRDSQRELLALSRKSEGQTETLAARLEVARGELSELRKAHAAEIREMQGEIATLKKSETRLTQTLEASKERDIAVLEAEAARNVDKYEARIATLSEKLENALAERDKFRDTLRQTTREAAGEATQAARSDERMQSALKSRDDRIQSLEAQIAELNAELREAQRDVLVRTRQGDAEQESYTKRLESAREALSESRVAHAQEIREKTAEIAALTRTETRLQTSLEREQSLRKETLSDLQALRREKAALEKALETARSDAEAAREEVEATRQSSPSRRAAPVETGADAGEASSAAQKKSSRAGRRTGSKSKGSKSAGRTAAKRAGSGSA